MRGFLAKSRFEICCIAGCVGIFIVAVPLCPFGPCVSSNDDFDEKYRPEK